MEEILTRLLQPSEPPPLEAVNPDGKSDFVLVCEHAGRQIPRALGDLGLPESELLRHIAWDVGARDISLGLSRLLDAPLFMQIYSRLVCDCNRRPDVATFIPEMSETTLIPGNIGLTREDRERREKEIFWPFHDNVASVLDARRRAGRKTLLITIHTFTPVFKGVARPWEIGVLFNRDRHFSHAVLDYLRSNTHYDVGENQPYSVGDETDYAIPVHGEARNLPCVEIEIRNDLTSGAAAGEWAMLIARAVTHAAALQPAS